MERLAVAPGTHKVDLFFNKYASGWVIPLPMYSTHIPVLNFLRTVKLLLEVVKCLKDELHCFNHTLSY